jgi:deoxyribodipyrimidine photolyase-related protein
MNSNQHNTTTKLSKTNYEKYWNANTNILPIDNTIKKILKYAYCHHIERLMVLGTYLLINNTSPTDTYNMFMEWTIDAYEWVMVPNVTMTTNNTDIMMSRMYINSSNYILKMSNYKKAEWCEIWDNLYNTYLVKHAKKLSQNYGTAMQVRRAFTWQSNFNKNKDMKL